MGNVISAIFDCDKNQLVYGLETVRLLWPREGVARWPDEEWEGVEEKRQRLSNVVSFVP